MYDDCNTEEVTKKYFEESHKLNDLLVHEELYWRQRAKAFWITDVDINSKFFHAFATSRKKLNKVNKLKNELGEEVVNHDDMCQIVKSYYMKFFDKKDMDAAELNDTTIVLIPEKESAVGMKDFRLLYKIIAKVLANHLKTILPDIITENQSACLEGILQIML